MSPEPAAPPESACCPICGAAVVASRCKLVCPRCRVVVENCNGD